MEQGQPARRAAEGVHAGDRLLAAVAALVEVYGGRDPADLVGDRAVVGVLPEAGLAAPDAQRLEGPHAAGGTGGLGVLRQVGAREDVVLPDATGSQVGRSPGHGQRVGEVSDLDAHHEAHPVEPLGERAGGTGLGVGGEGLAVVGAVHRVLDVPVGREHQRGRGHARLERLEVLGGQRVQPREAVGPADAYDAAVGQVDEAVAAHERALLAVERPVVRRHGSVDAVAAHRSGQAEQGARGRAGRLSHPTIVAHRW